ncbi:hypothetical protein FRC18_003382 [Serendipita sp. 400]|nr:hypothetical protein FRC18_003382 [Serendipita sp. 400]
MPHTIAELEIGFFSTVTLLLLSHLLLYRTVPSLVKAVIAILSAIELFLFKWLWTVTRQLRSARPNASLKDFSMPVLDTLTNVISNLWCFETSLIRFTIL